MCHTAIFYCCIKNYLKTKNLNQQTFAIFCGSEGWSLGQVWLGGSMSQSCSHAV